MAIEHLNELVDELFHEAPPLLCTSSIFYNKYKVTGDKESDMFIDESFDIRLPSINRAIYNNPGELRRFSGNVWAILESRFKFLPRFDCPVVVIITAFYPDERYVIDADNIFVKPVIDCLAKHCFHGGHDGFKEMREVRKRSRLGKSGFRVEVYAEEDMPC